MALLHLDTSALVKLVVAEPESGALAAFLDHHADAVVCTSVVGRVELLRAAARRSPAVLAAAEEVLAACALLPITGEVVEAGVAVQPADVRTLDALHLATALGLADGLTAFVAYDRRLVTAAQALALPVASPGAAPPSVGG